MSLFRGTIRPPAILSDEAVQRYLAAIRAELSPDPLFRRRLRGEVVNRYVAAREGIGAVPRRRAMGRLGRAVLYASFALAATGGSVLAASQDALPGELLYPLKLQVERLREQALPANLHDDLAAYAVAERIEELGRLAERGDWSLVAAQAATVEAGYRAFVQAPGADAAHERYLVVLTGLLERLPEQARITVEGVLDGLPGIGHGGPSGGGPANGPNGTGQPAWAGGGGNAWGGGEGGAGNANADSQGEKSRTTHEPKPTRTPKPTTSPDPADEDSP